MNNQNGPLKDTDASPLFQDFLDSNRSTSTSCFQHGTRESFQNNPFQAKKHHEPRTEQRTFRRCRVSGPSMWSKHVDVSDRAAAPVSARASDEGRPDQKHQAKPPHVWPGHMTSKGPCRAQRAASASENEALRGARRREVKVLWPQVQEKRSMHRTNSGSASWSALFDSFDAYLENDSKNPENNVQRIS